MTTKHTISINGQRYDALTGLRVANGSSEAEEPVAPAPAQTARPSVNREPVHNAMAVHDQVHKSSTLRRGHLKAPKSQIPVNAPRQHATAGHVAQSPMISHFASHPQPLSQNRPAKMINDIGPVVRQTVSAPVKRAPLPSREVKEQLIAEAGAKVDRSLAAKPKHEKKQRTPLLKNLRKSHFAAAGVAALLLVGYVTYLNVPGISVRLAAAQAGVDATYPDYNPDGYSFQGPVAFEQGEVDLHFKSNGGGEGYTIIQKNSDWNSVAVLDNLVNKASNGQYDVNSAGGITIYTYGTKAAWTNGGILYTIDGDAPLSSDQLVHIASSM